MSGHRAVEGWRVLERAVELAESGEAFVLATVVWREGPSSGQQGSRAIYTASGQMHGWIGGACAEPVFIREAQSVLATGQPRLLALGEVERFGDLPQGTSAITMSCQNEGALQIYLEPVVPVPHLVIVGDSPMAASLAGMAAQLDWRVERLTGPEFSEGMVGESSIVVVATQGHGDEDVIASALKAAPAYVGVVASHRRADAVREHLRSRGVNAAELDSLRIPAGLDLGSTTHKEVAVAILAELVQLRAEGVFIAEAVIVGSEAERSIDPVCGMTVDALDTNHPLEIDGETFYFCCPGCRAAYATERGASQ